ncbi:hypothetical protein J579_1107 [Acinetobacter sp. 1239920]|nr:hypothetical protein J579_1107 [Acinetobacter sp. 1239920]
MSLFQNIVIIILLIIGAGFLSLTEIALAGGRRGQAQDSGRIRRRAGN